MAGHSQFKNIMHRKGRQDAQKSKLFGKLAREITVAAKLGTPDPAMNPRLRAAVVAARSGKLVVLPTDTVYGVGCDAFDHGWPITISRVHRTVFESPPSTMISAPVTYLASSEARYSPA